MELLHATGMADALVKGGVVSEEDEAKTIRIITEYWYKRIGIVWDIYHLYNIGRNMGFELNEEEAIKILHLICKSHRRDVGVNLFTIEKRIREYVQSKY